MLFQINDSPDYQKAWSYNGENTQRNPINHIFKVTNV